MKIHREGSGDLKLSQAPRMFKRPLEERTRR
jgi:hypothetical protein